MTVKRFRKKPVEVEAIQWTGRNEVAILAFASAATGLGWSGDCVRIHTLEGTMTASPGDWIIRGVKGEFYPVKPEVFQMTYEPAEGA